MRRPLLLTLPLLLGLGACSPALDWRDLRWPEARLAVRLPCKPAWERQGTAARASCVAGDLQFSVAWQSADSVEAARAMINATRQRWEAQLGPAVRSLAPLPAGALAWDESGRYDWPQAQPPAAVMVWARGLQVYQATIRAESAGAPLHAQATEEFMAGIRGLD